MKWFQSCTEKNCFNVKWHDSNLALKKIKALILNNSNLTMKNLYYEMAWFQSCTEKMLMWNDMISILH